MQQCTSCGAALPPGANNCPACGAPTYNASATTRRSPLRPVFSQISLRNRKCTSQAFFKKQHQFCPICRMIKHDSRSPTHPAHSRNPAQLNQLQSQSILCRQAPILHLRSQHLQVRILDNQRTHQEHHSSLMRSNNLTMPIHNSRFMECHNQGFLQFSCLPGPGALFRVA